MEIAGFIPQSFTDWPGKACAVIFTPGCNFRCGFCHNPVLVEKPETLQNKDPDEVLAKLFELRWALDGVTITGGEPTLQPGLDDFCRRLKAMGFQVKLDTNGSRPEVLEKLLDEKLIDYVAMDVKAPMSRYKEITGSSVEKALAQSKMLIIGRGIDHEFRTTVVPGLIDEADIHTIARFAHGAKRFVLQQFKPGNCLDKGFNGRQKGDPLLLNKIAESLRFPEVRVRSELGEKKFLMTIQN